MRSVESLVEKVKYLEGKGYKNYIKIKGSWSYSNGVTLNFHHIQSDPFAPASIVEITVDYSLLNYPLDLWDSPEKLLALEDFINRLFKKVTTPSVGKGTGNSGKIIIAGATQEILWRNNVHLSHQKLTLRFRIGLPAMGRKIHPQPLVQIITKILPRSVSFLKFPKFPNKEARNFIDHVSNWFYIQRTLERLGLVSFIANGSILPRESGVSSKPLKNAIPFESPKELEVTIDLPNGLKLKGMGIPKGITVITGDGFHGKTTLLDAIATGVYPHIPEDGRMVVTTPQAIEVRSEDGRAINGTDISAFISKVPFKKTDSFWTNNASGSTSLAASIIEALEAKSDLLLIDEDTAATNLLIKDDLVRKIIKRHTITPLLDIVRGLPRKGVSAIIVIGGNGDYFSVADNVILMEEYKAYLVNKTLEQLGVKKIENNVEIKFKDRTLRLGKELDNKVKVKSKKSFRMGKHSVNVEGLTQIVDEDQLRFIAAVIRFLAKHEIRFSGRKLENIVKLHFKDIISQLNVPELAKARGVDIHFAISRIRDLIYQGGEQNES